MKVHEYQAKEILRRYGVPTPRGIVVDTPDEARQAAKELGGRVVIKAQIHAGGRGKGGGVKLAKDADEAAELTRRMLGMTLAPVTGEAVADVVATGRLPDRLAALDPRRFLRSSHPREEDGWRRRRYSPTGSRRRSRPIRP
jgi:succinyl-CoA synthetase beta subunit